MVPVLPRALRTSRWLLSLSLGLLLSACQSTPEYHPEERQQSYTLSGGAGTRLRDFIEPKMAGHESDQSALYLLQDGLEAFVARVTLMDEADVSLDLQYYIFADDTSGLIILAKALQAADRGVRVRLLVDDVGTLITDSWVSLLQYHPNIEIRVFNPVAARAGMSRVMQGLSEFERVNHRMHNKLLVADGQVIITGGRNIADAYFSNDETLFHDVDIICAGPVVQQATASFDAYWNHPVAVPLDILLPPKEGAEGLQRLRQKSAEFIEQTRHSVFAEALRETPLLHRIQSGELSFAWGRAQLYADPPDKAARHDEVDRSEYLIEHLLPVLARSEQRLQMSSAYFIPGDMGVEFLTALERRGVEVSVLTNALSTTDVGVVHSGYSKYRDDLLQNGIELWELRSQAGRNTRLKWFKGSSRASLHAKSFVIDDDRAVIGSVNLDGRSVLQNTEIGVYVENPEINRQLAETFARWTSPESAWRVTLDDDSNLRWQATDDEGNPIVEHKDPETSAWQRFKVWVLSLLPVEKQI
ncbi:phospholipase D family protein [Pseudomaricurvus sp. HS19]|uniref:phospholipase D family protein n=1 Tax=Pseudomaricurvus sp. HS19 TaxID=2692626 RepID=UPI0019274293|nr:phospholipase D family protein [Pseudomaricurvus sp. HS19]